MRSLALVLVVTLVGCIPMPTAAEAHYGNGLWLLASAAVIQNEARRNCTLHDDMGDVDPVASVACDAGSTILMRSAEVIAVAALIGIGRTLVASFPPPATTKANRSR